jgi:hypothetical protein
MSLFMLIIIMINSITKVRINQCLVAVANHFSLMYKNNQTNDNFLKLKTHKSPKLKGFCNLNMTLFT